MMRSIKGGHGITPSMVSRFSRLVTGTDRMNKPLPAVIDSTAITKQKIDYTESYVYDMLELLYGNLPKKIKRREFYLIMRSRFVPPPESAMERIFNSNSELDIDVFVKQFFNELTS